MRIILFFTTLLICNTLSAQHKYNDALKRQLDTILANDQLYRPFLTLQPGSLLDSLAKALGVSADSVNHHYSMLQSQLDSVTLAQVEVIFHRYGYPGKSLVGKQSSTAAYYVLQHSDNIKEYFPLIERAGKTGELPFNLVAMMQDRMLRNDYKEQIYGTQFAGFDVIDSVTHQQRLEWLLWPVKDYKHVNERRKKAGFDDTIEENAASSGISYKVITLAEARKRYPWLFPAPVTK